MKSRFRFLVVLFITFLCLLANIQTVTASVFISPNDPNIQYAGRTDFTDPQAPILYWSGAYITASFTGSSLQVQFDDTGDNYYNVIIDGLDANPLIIDCEKGLHTYTAVSGLPDAVHTIRLFRRTESFSGPTIFKGFILDDGKQLAAPPARPKHKIEFFGDSITCGMGNEVPDKDEDENNAKRNNYLAYGAITARNLDAEYVCIAKSGIGIVTSWFPLVMPEFYNRLNPEDSTSRWNFSTWTPEVVVINLFQNDSWLVGKLNPVPTPVQISAAYYDFVKTIRGKYPQAVIFCALGSMDATRKGSPWPGYIQTAVEQFKKDHNDAKIHTHFFAYDGTGKHPRVRHHQAMAKELTELIKKTMNW
ncbi:MAG TPA: SGNH/GDSL hydrolase family protein [bacterium]|nr:SGNH/GDSL hydrolase family protein [bacterium]HPN42959.1 SGNH/GDSL hydrolase family protein [bacterium]